MNYIRLIRLHNLLIMAGTLYAMRWLVIWPILHINGFEMQFGELNFLFLVIAVMCIAAGGYVINDYFDRKADRINNPDDVIVGKVIHRRFAMILHSVLNAVGALLGFYISYVSGHWKYGFVFLFITGILWFYSTSYKRRFLLGNFVIALITAIVPMMILLFEIPILFKAYKEIQTGFNTCTNHIFYLVSGFAFFAFITTMIREVIKDIEDMEGDAGIGSKTLPIILGIKTAKAVVLALIAITIASVFIAYFIYLKDLYLLINDRITFWYLFVICIPLIVTAWLLINAKDKKGFSLASKMTKLVMLLGVCYSFIIWYVIFENAGVLINA
ncbi:MAG: geranylgeranylglycerol-phosphate geranylgeranyltransferase [Bacteroidota bacterium]